MIGPTERRLLYTDIETFSSVDLRSAGAFKYIESPDFEIMLVAYAWGDEPVKVLDLFDPNDREEMQDVLAGLHDPNTLKIAHNNAFERNAYRRQYGFYQPPEEWDDTMILCAMNGLPMSLDAAGAALQLPEQKLKEGTALINYFCKPCKPTISNGGRTRNLPHHAPEKWARFKTYAGRDVVTMREIYRRLRRFPIPDWERRVWALDTRINERGVLVDRELAQAAIDVDEAFKADHTAEMRRLTGLENTNSVAQLKGWMETVGLNCESLNKETVVDLLDTATDPTTRRVLELRQLLGKTSTKKYQSMITAACADDRVRGIMQYYGAGRTGRWAGRIVQPQNLPQNHLDAIDNVRELVRQRDLETLEMAYDNVPDVLSQLIRTALIAKPGHTFLVADYSAIEARVINYLSGETWANEAFANGEDIYCKTASMTFGVPVVKHGINGHLRQRGKVMVLGLGYGMGASRFEEYSAGYGVEFEPGEAERIVAQWRQTSPTIPKFWRDTERAAKNALRNKGKTFSVPCGVRYRRDADALRCRLPSGRVLSYWGAYLDNGGDIKFMGQNQTSRKWVKMDTWGGKLVENIVQAYARDCLAVTLLRLDGAGYKTVFHVHDECVVEEPIGGRTWQDMAEVMAQPIDWAPGLLLRGDGYSTPFYMKD